MANTSSTAAQMINKGTALGIEIVNAVLGFRMKCGSVGRAEIEQIAISACVVKWRWVDNVGFQ